MTAVAVQPGFDLRPLRRAVRSPKGNLMLVLGGLSVLAALSAGFSLVIPSVFWAIAAAGLADLFIQRWIRRRWIFPTAGVLSGLIVALVLSPYEGGVIAPATAVVAVTSKHLFRTRLTNIFNPAAFALVLSALLFDSGHSWWGALPDWSWFGAALVLAAGSYTAERVNKLPLVLSFLGAFYGLFTIASFTGSSAEVASVFRAPDFQAALFFAFFMLDDPPTCPIKYPDQVIFGLIAAGVSFAAFEIYGWLFYLLAGVLVANAWWAIQRTIRGRRRASRPTPETAPRSGEWARPRQRI